MQVNRGLVFWGVALISAGAVALAIQAGIIDDEVARRLWQYWPVVLIVIGISILAARTAFALVATLVAAVVVGGMVGTLAAGWPDGIGIGCGGEAGQVVTERGSFDDAADVELDFNCGDLSVAMAEGADWSVEARHGGDATPEITSSGSSLRVTAEDVSVFGFSDARQEWDVTLPTEASIALSVEANAASSNLDLAGGDLSELGIDANAGEVNLGLAGASVDELSIDANAGSLSIDADDGTTLDGSVEMNAGSLELCVPDGVTLAITLADDNITFSHNLDESGLSQQGDTWSTGGDSAPTITLRVDGNAASFTLNPEEGCA